MGVWDKSKDEKVSFQKRAMGQDIGHRVKYETLRFIFPKKMVNGVDIGENCCYWAYSILTDLDNVRELQRNLLSKLLLIYKIGKDPNTWRPWLDNFLLELQSFADKVDKLTDIAKMSFMDKLKRDTEEGSDIDDQVW